MSQEIIRPCWTFTPQVVDSKLAELAGQEVLNLIAEDYIHPWLDLLWPPESVAYRFPLYAAPFLRLIKCVAPHLAEVAEISEQRVAGSCPIQVNVVYPGGAIHDHTDQTVDRSSAIGLMGTVVGTITDPQDKQRYTIDCSPGDEFALSQGTGRRRKLVWHMFENNGSVPRVSICK